MDPRRRTDYPGDMEHDADHPSWTPDATIAADLDSLAEALGPQARVGVLTGAGISAASGVPTFRGAGGLWKNHPAERLATPEGFGNDPALVWEWYGWRRDKIREAAPNGAHRALVDLARRVASLSILTQNVDGLHRTALGDDPPAVEIVELHGNLWRMRCMQCEHEAEDRRPGPAPGELPRCPCGGLLRPAVVWFGESLDPGALDRAAHVATHCDVFLVVGTSAVVQPAASFASVARRAGARVAEFNLEATELSGGATVAVHAPAEHALPHLVAAVDRLHGASA